MPVLLIVLLVLSSLGALFWGVLLTRSARMVARQPTMRDGLSEPLDQSPRVSVIVPAHNEEADIDRCVRSLREQRYPDLELIFVLDRCTDRTAEIMRDHAAADPRIVVIENEACPEGWAGKCNAARVGAEAASGVYLLFTDADTIFDPDLVRAAVGLATARNLGLLSILSTLTCDEPFERIAQPVATMMLVHMYPFDRVDRPGRRSRPFANGQFMLFSREAYDAVGGHAAVRDDLLEDIAFARHVVATDRRCGVFLADGMLVCSMYDSLDGFREGWKRIFIEACKRKPRRLRKNGRRVLVVGMASPVVQVAGLLGGGLTLASSPWLGAALLATAGASIILQTLALTYVYAIGGVPRRSIPLFPLGGWIVARILFAGAADLDARRPIRWGGREYILEPRSG